MCCLANAGRSHEQTRRFCYGADIQLVKAPRATETPALVSARDITAARRAQKRVVERTFTDAHSRSLPR